MASLLSYIGNSNGVPDTLTDEEQQALLDQQQNPPSAIAALMGNPGADSTSADTPEQVAAPIVDNSKQSLLANMAAGDTSGTGSDANPSYATASQADASTPATTTDATASTQATSADTSKDDTGSDASPAYDSPTTSDSSSTNASADSSATAPSAATSATGDGSSNDSPGFLHKLLGAVKSDPDFGTALMQAGFNMMANSRYGTPGLAAVGSGALAGTQAYTALRQQHVTNALAARKMDIQAAMDNSVIAKNNADTGDKTFAHNQVVQRQNTLQQIGAGQLSANDPNTRSLLAATGMTPADITAAVAQYSPKLGTPQEYTDQKTGQQMVQDQTEAGALVGQPRLKAAAPIAVSAGQNLVQPQVVGPTGSAQQVASGGMTPEQQGNLKTYSDTANVEKSALDKQGQLSAIANSDAVKNGWDGAANKWAQPAIKALGLDDPNSQFRQQLAQDQNAQIFASLPAGSRMDQKEFVALRNAIADPQTMTPTQIKNYLQLSQAAHQAKYSQSMANYNFLNANPTGSSLPKDTTINGQVVPAGTTLPQYVQSQSQGIQYFNAPKGKQAAGASAPAGAGSVPVISQSAIQAEIARRKGGK